ncbi:MAG: hypothetical protein M1368_06930 [Thaumarchaeota archaeon]|nr:hypothetical protein [Nitrososphaerota archaeon]
MRNVDRSISSPVAIFIAFAIVLIVIFGTYVIATRFPSTTTSSTVPTCPPTCPTSASETLYINVTHSGPWKVDYSTYNSFGTFRPLTNGSYTGTGDNITSVVVSGNLNYGFTLCALASKLDSSNTTLTLRIDTFFENSSSAAYAIVKSCGSVVP